MSMQIAKFFSAQIKKMADFIHACLFPVHCVKCGAEGQIFCDLCVSELQGSELQTAALQSAAKTVPPTSACLSPAMPAQVLSAYQYPAIAKLVRAFKYDQISEAGKICAKLLVDFAGRQQINFQTYAITFVPMHSRKQNIRGFNQAQILAQAIATAFGAPCKTLLTKNANTKPQADLNKEQRALNLAGSFACRAAEAPEKIILIDDVFTTGSTLKECCAQLYTNGAKEIICLTLARD